MVDVTETKYALVTGGSRGIGAAIVARLAAAGYHVAFTYLSNETAAGQVKDRVHAAGGSANPMQTDLTNIASIEKLLAAIPNSDVPHLDVVVNNAAILPPVALIEDTAFSVWSDNLMIAATAPFLIIKHVIPYLRPGASVINISTINASTHPVEGVSAYAAVACSRWMSPASSRVLWPDVGREGTMNVWLVGSGIPRRTSCANCAVRMS